MAVLREPGEHPGCRDSQRGAVRGALRRPPSGGWAAYLRASPTQLKVNPFIVLLAGALVGALAWGSCNAGRASDAETRLNAQLAANRDSATQWETARQALTVSLGALRRDSSTLARNLTRATGAAQRASQRAESLFLRLPDTLRVGVRLVFDSLAGATMACEAARANCELRAQNAEARARGDSNQLVRLTILTDTLEASWRSAERRAQP